MNILENSPTMIAPSSRVNILSNTARSRLYSLYGLEEEWSEVILNKISDGNFILTDQEGDVIHGYVYLHRMIGFTYNIRQGRIITFWRVKRVVENWNFYLKYAQGYLEGNLNEGDLFRSVIKAYRNINKHPLRTAIMRKKIDAIANLQSQIDGTKKFLKGRH